MTSPSHPVRPSVSHPLSVDWLEPSYARVLAALGAGGPLEQAVRAPNEETAVATLLDRVERDVQASPGTCFSFTADGHATLTAGGRTFAAGRFTTPTLGELRARLASRRIARGGRLVLSAFQGADPLTDIGTLQATAAPGTLFQVASQFNCLEATSPEIVSVRDYLHDPTQGPRAAVSAFPGTLLRHYAAPTGDGGRFQQTDAHCLNLLRDVFDSAVAEVRSGYLQTSHVHDAEAFACALSEAFDQVRVGVHDDVEVAFGHDWGGPIPGGAPPRIAQVFTSTIALTGGGGGGSGAIATARHQLLRAAYLGTLFSAVDLGKHTVVLTLIGGGAFNNPSADIWAAIHWALAEAEPLLSKPLTVIVNARTPVDDADRAEVRKRGGVVVEFSRATLVVRR